MKYLNRLGFGLFSAMCLALGSPGALSQENQVSGEVVAAVPASAPKPAPPPSPSTPVAASPAPPAPARNIRFQFEGIPYTDVIERFAQMAAKPLLSDTNVLGTLTYNDPSTYNYQEALDTLNLILSMKGVMLVESGNNLRLVPFKELPSMPLRILRGLDATGDARPGEIVTVVLDVKNLDSKEIADAVTSMLSKAGSLAPLSRGRGLIVTDLVSNIQRIRTLLATIDTEAAVNRQMKTYTLLHASGSIIADLLNRTFGIATAPKRTAFNPNTKAMEVLPPDPNEYITAVYDDASRTLVLFGPNERLILAEDLINKFEQKEGAGGDVRIYFPQTIKAEDLANVIRQAIPGVASPNETAANAATKARIIADKDQQRLIVAAPIPGQLEQIEQLINRVDKPIHGQPNGANVPLRSQTVQLTKVFRPRAAESTNVAHILTQALTRRSPSGQIVSTASISFDPGSQSVVVTGGPNDVQVASDIVSQLETGSTQPTALQTRFIEVGTAAEAKRLLPLVEQLYRNQVADGTVGAVAHAKILSDPTSGRLIVTASEDHLSRIETLVRQLRADKPMPQPRRLQIITLQHARVDAVISNIQSVVTEKMSEKPFADIAKPSILPDASNNRLLVTATEDQINEIQQMVAVIDIAPMKGRREMQVIPLTTKTAAEIIPVVTQLLEQTSEGATNPQLAPKLSSDPTGKQIIALAQPKDLERLQVLVKQFDTTLAAASPREFKGVDLFARTATDFTPLVTKLYQEQLKGVPEPLGGAATLIADTANNRIMVSGPEKEIARVEAIIRQLDGAGQKAAREETRVMRLKMASASEIAALVEKSVNARNQQVRVLVDNRSNSLVVNGETTAVAAAAQIILELDARPDSSPRDMRIIDLRSGDASALAPMISNLFAEMMKDLHGAEYVSPTKVVPDTSANRLIVTGPRDDLAQVAKLVAQLDQTPEQSGSARVFKLQLASATMLAPIVSNAMVRFDQRGQPIRKVMISADEKSNSLIVTGGRTDVQDAAVIIERLDGDSDTAEVREKGRELKIIPVNTPEPDSLAALAFRVFAAQNSGRNVTNLLSITPEPTGKRLIVLAPASLMSQVETVVAALDQPADQAAKELHAIELKGANAKALFPVVSRVYEEQSKGKRLKPATIYADVSGMRLNVWGTAEQADTIRQIVATLESENRAPRETKVFDAGRLADAQRLLPLIQQIYKDQQANNTQSGPADAQFISDGRTGRIIVSASQEQMPGIGEIVTRLLADSAPGKTERETRTFDVGTAADVQRLLPIVQQLYQNHWKDKQETDPADAQIVGDALAGRIITSGKTEHLKHIEAILNQLGSGKPRAAAGPRETRVFDLTTATASELSTTVRALYLDQAKARLGTLSPDTLIMPDSSANRIIATGDTTELDAVEEIIKKLDKVGTQSASARVFKLKFAEPDKVMEILSSALVRYDAFGRPQKRVSITVDANTRTLIATGDPKELQAASVIIEQLDSSLGESAERRMKLVSLKNGRAAEVSSKLRQLYVDQMKSRPALGVADALILEDAASNQLILTANEGQLALLEQILADLQAARSGQAARETRIIAIGQAEDVTRLLPLVRQLYEERWRDRSASDPADAQILSDSRNGRFIVTARTNHIEAIEGIVATLRPPSALPGAETRVFDLGSSSATELAGTVRSLYQEQIKSRPVIPALQPVILADSIANRLIVTGATNELAAVEEIVKKLDKADGRSGGSQVFTLSQADPEQVASLLSTSLVRVEPNGRRLPRVSVGTDPRNSMVVVSGEPADLRAASLIIEQVDKAATKEPRLMRVLELKTGMASEAASKIRQIYQDQSKSLPATGGPEPLLMGDAATSRLIVTATEPQMKLIEDIVSKLEEGRGGSGRQLRVLLLERNSASSISLMISRLYARQIASQDPGERVVVSSGADDRTLVIDAAGQTLENLEQLVKTLDRADNDVHGVIQAIHLKKGDAASLADAVNKTMAARLPINKSQRVSVTAVPGANSLLINGPTNTVQEVMKIVRELDHESEDVGVEVRIFKLENGNVREIQGVLRQILENVTESIDRNRVGVQTLPATISVDERSNSLIITATEAHFKTVEKILPTLDKAPERSDRDVQFVWLRKAKAFDVVSKVEAVFSSRSDEDRPVIEADGMNNSITIIARRGDLAQIQDLIARLDDTAKDSSLQVRLRPMDRIAADQMARMLQNIYPQMAQAKVRVVDKLKPGSQPAPAPAALPPLPPGQPPAPAPQATLQEPAARGTPEVVIAIDKDANSLLLSGPIQELDNIDRIITELSFSVQGNESEFRMFPLKEADPVNVARALTELLKQDPIPAPPGQGGQPPPVFLRSAQPRIAVVAEPRARSVIIRARPTDFVLLESLIKQLDVAGQTAQLDFKVVPLTHAPPTKVLPLVQQMVTQLNVARPGEPLSVSIDPRSRGLLVVARDTVLNQVEKMIRSLDTVSPHAEAEVMVVPLKKANAAQLASVLQAMLRPAAPGESNLEARELQEQVRRLKVFNDEGEEVLLDLTQPIKIAADPVAGQGGGNRLLITATPNNLKALAIVVKMMDNVPVAEGVSVRLVRLEHADAATVSQTLTTIFSQGQRLVTSPAGPGAEPEGPSGKALVNPLNIAVDARSNTLILSGQTETLRLALRVIDDIDQQVDRFVTEVRLFRLKHASATRLLPLLQSVFAEGPAVPGTEGLSAQVSRLRIVLDPEASRTSATAKSRAALVMQADDLSNVLIVAARSDTLPLIADVIDQLDTPAAYGLESVRIYPLNHADPSTIQKVLSDLYTGPRSTTLRNEDKPVVSIDDRTGSLIVAGNAKSFAIVEGLLQRLDQKLPFDLRDIRIIPLENADAGTLAGTMQRLVDARMTQRASSNRGAADSLKVIILADPRSNSLLVGGSKDSFELVESLAKELDKSGPALSGQIRIIPLEHADARVVGATLVTLFEQRYAAARAPDVGRNKPVILPDPRSNSLLVAANMEDNRTLDDLVKRLDQKLENPSLTLTVLPLKHNDSAKVASMLESLFTARMRAQVLPGQAPLPSEQIKIEPDPLNNALIVSANKENVELIQNLLQKIDAEPVIPGGMFETFTLQFADAQRVSTLLKSLVDQGLYRPGLPSGTTAKGTGRDALALSVDTRGNTLIVSASPENLALVREVIRRVDNKDFAAVGDVRLYSLKHARASTLAATLTQFFQAKKAADTVAVNAGEKLIPVSVIADDRVNMLVVTGGKEAFDTAERVIQQLDGEGVFSRLNFRVFPLKKATATKLQSSLQPIFANRPPKVKGEPLDPITIVADSWVNALLVGASVEDMVIVESLLNSLDTDPTDVGLSVHVYPLAKADARRVATTVQSIYRDGAPGATLPIAVSADERMNAIVVSAGEVDARRIGELVKKLDTDQVARVSEIKVFALRYARAESLAAILTTSLNTKPTPLTEQSPNAQSVLQFITRTEKGKDLVTSALKEAVLITAEPRENSLIVSAPVDYMGLLEQIITRLDNASHRKAKIKVFNLINADARQTSELLTAMFQMQATPGAGASGVRSVQYTLVRPFTNGSEGAHSEAEVASAVLGTDEQSALTVSVDARTNSLLVGGTEDYVELVSQIIDSLDSSPAAERKTEVVRLRNSQALDVATAVRTFLDQERTRVTQVLGTEAVGTAQRMLEREIAVVPEAISNTLLVSASPRYFDQVRTLIEDLDQAQSQVLIQVLIAEVSLDDGLDLGLEWTFNGTPFAAGVDISASKWITSGFSSAVTGGDYSFLFRALEEKGRLEVLSRPQIVTADNKPALINVGQTIPLITDSRVTPQGDTINSFRYENVGVNLKVTPRIAPDGFVKMEVGTTNSTISSSTVQINRNAEVPILNQRIASTTVSVQSGQSILIGGLIGTTDDTRVRKVPWLGDIPGLGYLFRTSRVKKERRELLILLTPQVLTKSEAIAIMKNTREVTDDQLRSSRIKDEIKRDATQNQILDPVFPSDDSRKALPSKEPAGSRKRDRELKGPGI